MLKEHGPKIIIIALIVFIVGLPLMLRPTDAGLDVQAEPVGKLVIYTPHNEQIRFEMERGFNDWRASQGLGPITFDWRASGGTSDLRKTVLSQFGQLAKSQEESSGIGADLFFGGGAYDHGKLKGGITDALEITSGLSSDGVIDTQSDALASYPLYVAPYSTLKLTLVVDGAVVSEPVTVKLDQALPEQGDTLTFSDVEMQIKNPTDQTIRITRIEFDPKVVMREKAGVALKLERDLSVSVPLIFDEDFMAEVYPTALIGGEKLYDAERYWLGTALSSFGIVYNRDVLKMLDLPEPTTWQNLADPRYQNYIALADPGHSGSISATYHAILQRLGWEEGWKVLRRVFANARYFSAGSNKIPSDVSTGDAAAGMCIDFYGRYQAGAVQFDDSEQPRMGYIDPFIEEAGRKVSMTATTADPISLLRGAPNREDAVQFVEWALSRDAQKLWQRKLKSKLAGDDASLGNVIGPTRFELRRMPIRRDLYTTDEQVTWADPEIEPFETASPVPDGTPNYFSSIAPVTKAMAIDLHDDLVAAWRTINATPDGPKKQQMLELFDAMPEQLTIDWPSEDIEANWAVIINDPQDPRHATVVETLKAFKNKLRGDRNASHMDKLRQKLQWTLFFRDNYQKIVELGNQ